MKIGIRGKLFLIFLLADLFLLVVIGFYLDVSLKEKLTEDLELRLNNHAKSARLIIEKTVHHFDPPTLDAIAVSVGAIVGERVTIIDGNGLVLGDSHVPLEELATLPSHLDRPEVTHALRGSTGISQRHSATIDQDMVYLALPVMLGERLGAVRVAISLREMRDSLQGQRAILALAGLLAIGLAALMTALASELITRPFRQLTVRAANLTHDISLGPLPVHSQDEIGGLAGSFNQLTLMLEHLVTELAEDRTRMGAVLQYMGDGVVALDQEQRLTLINPYAQRLLGLETPRLGTRLHNQITLPRLQELLAPGTFLPQICNVEFDLETPDHRWITVLGTALQPAGGCVLVLRDITDHRQLELKQKEFVANVSHELRTPVHAILLHAELLQESLTNRDAPTSNQFALSLERNATRLGRIIDDLLYLSRLEAAPPPLEWAPVDLGQVCRSALEPILPLAREKGISFTFGEEPPPSILSNGRLLGKVLFNLYENALIHCPRGTGVAIRARARADGGAQLEVEDQGPGVPAHHRERLFERFYRVENSRSRALGGTGLGLAIVRQLVNRLGGEVGMEPVEPHGARFWVRLPPTPP